MCSRFELIRVNYKEQLITILSWKESSNVVKGFLSDSEKFVDLVLDCSVTIFKETLLTDESMVLDIEHLSRKLLFSPLKELR